MSVIQSSEFTRPEPKISRFTTQVLYFCGIYETRIDVKFLLYITIIKQFFTTITTFLTKLSVCTAVIFCTLTEDIVGFSGECTGEERFKLSFG